MSEEPSLTAREVEQILYDSAMDLGEPGKDEYFGHGFINARAALELVNKGGCCDGDSCSVVTETECATLGGLFLGFRTNCDNSPCSGNPDPLGACCTPDSCAISTDVECAGMWLGEGTDCENNPYCQPSSGYILVPLQHASIQEAVYAASTNDIILVAPGEYTGSGETVLKLHGKAITIQSIEGAEHTILDGQNLRQVVTCSSGETSATVIDGFTITGGHSTTGGGIYCVDSSPTFSNCVIDGNTATSLGGGLYSYQNHPATASPAFTDCTWNANTAPYGGGIYCSDSSPSLTDCIVSGSTAGGGIYGTSGTISLSRTVMCQNSPVNIDGNYVDGQGNRLVQSCPGCDGDISGEPDSSVNQDDLQWLLAAWNSPDVLADIDGSGSVGVHDLIMLLAAWGACN